MARKVNPDQIDQVDEILKHQDPEFVKALEQINGDELKVADLEAAFAEAEKHNTAVHRFWENASTLQRIAVLTAMSLVLFSPGAFAIWYYYLRPPPVAQLKSLEPIADAVYDFNTHGADKNFFDAFLEEEFLFEVPDHVFYMREKRDIRMGRFAFYLELGSKADLKKADERSDEIIETLNTVFAHADVDDFAGVAGKEGMKKKMLDALNKKIPIGFKNIRFRMMVFN